MLGGRDRDTVTGAAASLHLFMQAHERMKLGSTKAHGDDVSGWRG